MRKSQELFLNKWVLNFKYPTNNLYTSKIKKNNNSKLKFVKITLLKNKLFHNQKETNNIYSKDYKVIEKNIISTAKKLH